jgi:hypothetical protein
MVTTVFSIISATNAAQENEEGLGFNEILSSCPILLTFIYWLST